MTIKDWWVNWRMSNTESKTNVGPYRTMTPVDIPPKGLGKINLLQRLLEISDKCDRDALENIDQLYAEVEDKMIGQAKIGSRMVFLDHMIKIGNEKAYSKIKEMLKADGLIVDDTEKITWRL